MKDSITVTITGAAGQIGYSLLFRIASGGLFGPDQPVHLNLVEIEPAMKALEGTAMELDDCAFPLLSGITATSDLDVGFQNSNWALLVGSVPRKAGMERKDLLGINGNTDDDDAECADDDDACKIASMSVSVSKDDIKTVALVALLAFIVTI